MHTICALYIFTLHYVGTSTQCVSDAYTAALWTVCTSPAGGSQGPQDCKMAAVKGLGQYCGRCTQSVHYIYSPCMMWAHPLNVSPISLRRPYGRHAHRLWDVPKARNIARLQGCPRIPGAILRAAIKVLGQYCGRCTQPVHSIYSP